MDYKVTRDYHNEEFDFDLVEGDVVSDKSFSKNSKVMVDRLIGRGVLYPIKSESEHKSHARVDNS